MDEPGPAMVKNMEKDEGKYRKEALRALEQLLSDYSFYGKQLEKLIAVVYHVLTKNLDVEESEDLVDVICNDNKEDLIIWIEQLFIKKKRKWREKDGS